MPSRSSPAHSGLPWRVYTTDRARSKANAAACPPFPPTARSVTAGLPVEVPASLYRVATVTATGVAPARVYRSAVPWNCIVCPTMPWPGAALVSTWR
jgi:hypothetical protein